MIKIALIGATGSIGTQTLDVARRHPDKLEVIALAANSSVDAVLAQAHEFRVRNIAFGNAELARDARLASAHGGVKVGFGPEAVAALASIEEADVVVNALVGAAGLRASYETLAAGKVLALANKESLVVGGDLIMPMAAKVDAARRAAGVDRPNLDLAGLVHDIHRVIEVDGRIDVARLQPDDVADLGRVSRPGDGGVFVDL